MIIRCFCALPLVVSVSVLADDPAAKQTRPAQGDSEVSTESESDTRQPPDFVLTDDVRDALLPLFSSIAQAKASRATVEMLADSLVGGSVVDSQNSTYHIASIEPDKFTIYLKEPEQRTRIYNDGKSLTVALSPEAYVRLPDAIGMQDAVTSLPVPMGPYPEPVLALTLAGVDPAISFVGGMKSIEVVDREDFRGTPSIHLRGVQADAVTWDFWISKQNKPLRLLVDLTPMLVASQDLDVPEHFSYQVRFDFLSWRVTGEVDESLFTYNPPKDAKEYKSQQEYYDAVVGAAAEHPLLGKPAPPFKATTLAGKKIDSKDLDGKVIVLDFWATWCTPCLAAIPVLKQVTDDFAEQDVVFLAVNAGEQKAEIEEFLKQQELNVNIVLDPEGKVADAYAADAIPQTVVIGKSGAVESVHIGFLGEDPLKQRLTDELEVLSVGGKIATVEDVSAQQTRESKGGETR
jgi:thiol-disulfide isomerase/thioredoxin